MNIKFCLLLTCALLLGQTFCEANDYEGTQQLGNILKPMGPSSQAPTISYYGNILTLKSDTTYNNAHVTMTNKQGEIVYDKKMDITTMPQNIVIYDHKLETITINCDKDIFIGFFE